MLVRALCFALADQGVSDETAIPAVCARSDPSCRDLRRTHICPYVELLQISCTLGSCTTEVLGDRIARAKEPISKGTSSVYEAADL